MSCVLLTWGCVGTSQIPVEFGEVLLRNSLRMRLESKVCVRARACLHVFSAFLDTRRYRIQVLLRSVPLGILDAPLIDTPRGEEPAASSSTSPQSSSPPCDAPSTATGSGGGSTGAGADTNARAGAGVGAGAGGGAGAGAGAGAGGTSTTSGDSDDTPLERTVLPEASNFEAAWRSILGAGSAVGSRLVRQRTFRHASGAGNPATGPVRNAQKPGPVPPPLGLGKRAITMSAGTSKEALALLASQWVGLSPPQAQLLVRAQRSASGKRKVPLGSVTQLLQCVPSCGHTRAQCDCRVLSAGCVRCVPGMQSSMTLKRTYGSSLCGSGSRCVRVRVCCHMPWSNSFL